MKLQASIILLFTFLFALCTNAQQTGYFDVDIVRSGKSLTFPIFSQKRNSRTATRINRLLQLSELVGLAKNRSESIFEQAKVDDGSIYGGRKWMTATIYSNNRRILSLGFDESSCGMTCTYWHRYYNFNSGNGDRMELKDLFTPKGYERFSKWVAERRSIKYRREVRKKVKPEYQDGYLDTIGCIENDDLTDYYIHNGTIVVDGENCLIKGQKFDGLDMYVRFSIREFRSHLSDYGRIVFGKSKADIALFRSTQLPQLFEGSIDGSLPIAMVLNREYGSGVRGVYAYLKYGEGIGLRGSWTESGIVMTEYALSGVTEMKVYGPTRKYLENGHITATLRNGVLEGKWSNKDKSRNLLIVASVK